MEERAGVHGFEVRTMRRLSRKLGERVSRIEILESVELIEKEPDYTRKIGYELLQAKFTRRCK